MTETGLLPGATLASSTRCLWLCLILLPLLLPQGASAKPSVIPPGHEAEVEALFLPFATDMLLEQGVRFDGIQIDRGRISARLIDRGGREGQLSLVSTDEEAQDVQARSASFQLLTGPELRASPALQGAAAQLIEAVQKNDAGTFWESKSAPTAPSLGQGLSLKLLGALASDGLLLTFLVILLLLIVAGDGVKLLAPRERWILLGFLLLGVCLRGTLSQETAFGPWPYERVPEIARAAYEGPVLRFLAEQFSLRIALSDLIFVIVFVHGLLAPLAIFAHGRYLLGSGREVPGGIQAALWATAVVSVLPLHLRYAHSEVSFVVSLVWSSAAFVVAYIARGDRRTWLRVFALIVLPFFMIMLVRIRPLNGIFAPLVGWVALDLRGDKPRSPWWRALVALVATVPAFVVAIQDNSARVATMEPLASPFTFILHGMGAFFLPSENTFLNPMVTPPGFLLLALLGAVAIWGRSKPKAAFLTFWFCSFFVAHTIVPAHAFAMGRYHLHLVPPFVLLTGLGVLRFLESWPRQAPWVLALAFLAPVAQLSYVLDVDFGDLKEYAFVREIVDKTPEGCVVIEYMGSHMSPDDLSSSPHARFRQLGWNLDKGAKAERFVSLPVFGSPDEGYAPKDPGDVLAAASTLPGAAECLYYYEGLLCHTETPESDLLAPFCQLARDRWALEALETTTVLSRFVDGRFFLDATVEDTPLALTLYRVAGEKASGAP